MEAAIKEFDAKLGVPSWHLFDGDVERETPQREPGAPWWWDGAEEASSSFLSSMGVTLDG